MLFPLLKGVSAALVVYEIYQISNGSPGLMKHREKLVDSVKESLYKFQINYVDQLKIHEVCKGKGMEEKETLLYAYIHEKTKGGKFGPDSLNGKNEESLKDFTEGIDSKISDYMEDIDRLKTDESFRNEKYNTYLNDIRPGIKTASFNPEMVSELISGSFKDLRESSGRIGGEISTLGKNILDRAKNLAQDAHSTYQHVKDKRELDDIVNKNKKKNLK